MASKKRGSKKKNETTSSKADAEQSKPDTQQSAKPAQENESESKDQDREASSPVDEPSADQPPPSTEESDDSPAATPATTTPPCCAESTSQDDGEWDPYEPGIRPHFLFKMSGFVFIVAAIFITFGGHWLAREYLPPISVGLIEAHSSLISTSIMYGLLFLLASLLMKLYGVLTVLTKQEADAGYQEDGSEWFLRHAVLILAFVGGAILVRGFLETRMVMFVTPGERSFVDWYTNLYAQKCVLSGTFFLGLAVFTQIYLLAMKLTRGTEFESDF